MSAVRTLDAAAPRDAMIRVLGQQLVQIGDAGQPQPESNLSRDENNGSPLTTST